MKLLYFAAKTCTNWKRCTHTHTCTHMHTLTLKKGSLSSNRFILHTAETKPWKAKIEKSEKKKKIKQKGDNYIFTHASASWITLKLAPLKGCEHATACNKLPKIRAFSHKSTQDPAAPPSPRRRRCRHAEIKDSLADIKAKDACQLCGFHPQRSIERSNRKRT